jgi:hypothetical protein
MTHSTPKEAEKMETCIECGKPSIARIMVLSTGLNDLLCEPHLSMRRARYEGDLTPFQIVSLVKLEEGIEADYRATLGNLKDSERATKETLDALRATSARNAELELDTQRLARQLAEERHAHALTRERSSSAEFRVMQLEQELAQHREPEAPPTPEPAAS